MFAKIHSRADAEGRIREVVAVCDAGLLGKKLVEKELVLDLGRYRGFYEGEKVTEGKAVMLIAAAESLNLVGEKALAAARKARPIDEKAVRRIAGVPHLQIYRV
ncbi:Uncharacterised protein [Candidatus Norongarragalina meridionalis]|nr:Uncharacterised protein [Candidatus Norongarragalina meridionalis]